MALQRFGVDVAVERLTIGIPGDGGEPQRRRNGQRLRTEGGESVVCSCDMLSRVPATSVAPLASELLQEEENDDLE